MEISIYNQNFVYLEMFKKCRTYVTLYFNKNTLSGQHSRNGVRIKGFNNENRILNNWDNSFITLLLDINLIKKTSVSLANHICLESVLAGLEISQVPKKHRTLNIAYEFFQSKEFNISDKRNFLNNFPIPEETIDKGSFTLISDSFTKEEYITFLKNNLIIKDFSGKYIYIDKNITYRIPTEYNLILRDFLNQQNKQLAI